MQNHFVHAIVDLATGETLVAHPSEKDLFVTREHFQQIAQGAKHAQTNCVYTEQQVCTNTVYTGSGPICTNWATVRTCRCT